MRLCAAIATALATASVAPGGGSLQPADYRQRLETALRRYQTSDTMDCAYPNKHQWWASLSVEGIEIVSTRNPPALVRGVRECLHVTEVEPSDLEGLKGVLAEWLQMRLAADEAAGTPVSQASPRAEQILRQQRQRDEAPTPPDDPPPPPPPPPPPAPPPADNDACMPGWAGEDCSPRVCPGAPPASATACARPPPPATSE